MGFGYRICGIDLESPVELHARPLPAGAAPRVRVEFEPDRPIPFGEPPGKVLARYTVRRSGYVLIEQDEHFVQRVFGICDFTLDKSLTFGRLAMSPAVGRRMAPIMLAGNLITAIATLRGGAVLHAGAVTWNGLTIAVTGPSGAGKSTTLAFLCAHGARMLAEDALSLEVRDDGVWGHSGSHELRLRPRSLPVMSQLDGAVAATEDARYGIRLPAAGVDAARIDVVVIPQPARDREKLACDVLDLQDALMRLMSFPRILGGCSPEWRRATFKAAARLSAQAPTVVAQLPWGPPFAPELGADLLSALERTVGARAKSA